MTSLAKLDANRRNAALSTGPATAAGKAAAALNPVRHGMTSAVPVIAGEDRGEWERHRAATVAALAPAGHLEDELAERAAGLLWRLRRVVAYEAAVTSHKVEEALASKPEQPRDWLDQMVRPGAVTDGEVMKNARKERKKAAERAEGVGAAAALLAGLLDRQAADPVPRAAAAEVLFEAHEHAAGALGRDCPHPAEKEVLAAAGVTTDSFNAAEWTAGSVRAGLRFYAAAAGQPLETFLADQRGRYDAARAEAGAEAQAAARRVEEMSAAADAARVRKAARLVLPDATVLDKVGRYEAHLSRQLEQTLNRLERLRAMRAGADLLPPAAGTLTLTGGECNGWQHSDPSEELRGHHGIAGFRATPR